MSLLRRSCTFYGPVLTTSVPVFALFIELGDGTPLQVVVIISLSWSKTTTIFFSLLVCFSIQLHIIHDTLQLAHIKRCLFQRSNFFGFRECPNQVFFFTKKGLIVLFTDNAMKIRHFKCRKKCKCSFGALYILTFWRADAGCFDTIIFSTSQVSSLFDCLKLSLKLLQLYQEQRDRMYSSSVAPIQINNISRTVYRCKRRKTPNLLL